MDKTSRLFIVFFLLLLSKPTIAFGQETTPTTTIPPCCDGGEAQWQDESAITTLQTPSSVPRTRAIVGEPKYLSIAQYPQEKCNWCGPAVAFSISKFYKKTFSQTQLATYAGTGLNPPQYCSCPDNDPRCTGTTDMARLLTYATGSTYSRYTYSTAIQTPTNLARFVWDAIYYSNRPLAANTHEPQGSTSYNNHTANGGSVIAAPDGIGHYVGIIGVSFSNLRILDPAANSQDLGWQEAKPIFTMTAQSLASFVGPRGIFK